MPVEYPVPLLLLRMVMSMLYVRCICDNGHL